MIVECDNCGNENLIPRADISYRCRSCAAPIEIPRATTADEHHHSEQPTTDLISEFIRALDQEIAAIKAGKGGSVVRVFDGRFIRETSGLFVYSFTLEDFIATVDDAPVEVQVGGSSYKGQIIQTQGLEVIIGVDHNFGPSIPDARLITNLYFLYEMLKKKFVAIRDGELSEDFSLPINVFHNHRQEPPQSVTLPELEIDPTKRPNSSQWKAIELSQGLTSTLVWGPPGTGKTETLAWIVECYIKQGMKALVVAHANAAVDEATEDIANLLRETEFYNLGQIIRLGIPHKQELLDHHKMVVLENVIETFSEALKREKGQIEDQRNKIERSLSELRSVLNAIQERDQLSRQCEQITAALLSRKREISTIKEQLNQNEEVLRELQAKLNRAESSGALKRFFFGLDPVTIRQEIAQARMWSQGKTRQLRERELKVQEFTQQHAKANANLSEINQRIDASFQRLALSESGLRSREHELLAEQKKISERLNVIERELEEIQKRILSEAKVICTTLTKTFSAREFPDTPFDVLVVDEASMAPMPHLYWALSRCRKAAVIVGDFLQLPPICVSDESMAHKWLKRSIYEHLGVDTVTKAQQDNRVVLLDTQYRMNPQISAIANQRFYKGHLRDDPSTRDKVIDEGLSRSPLTIIDTSSASPWCSRRSGGSRFNLYSALLATTMATKIVQTNGLTGKHLGIITPYAAQARLIGKILEDMDIELRREIRVATVHRFQGGEKEIIIFDTVEGPGAKVTPMLDNTEDDSDASRVLNVAMTRAQCKIFLLANLRYLRNQLSTQSHLRKILGAFQGNGQWIDCKQFVDSYFVRDFEKWVHQFLKSVGSTVVEPPEGSVVTEREFYAVFLEDLRNAEEEVIILSPFVSINRSGQLVELFRTLIQKGVRVRIFTRLTNQQRTLFSLNAEQVIEQMRAIGVEVTERKKMHQKVAIIDRTISWEGSLNILSHSDSGEHMRRLPFAKTANELVRLFEVDEPSIGGDERIRTTETCPECREEMVIWVGKYGPFLRCSDQACSGKRNINRWDIIITHTLCRECGRPMILRRGRRGPFLGCPGYPDCKGTSPIR